MPPNQKTHRTIILPSSLHDEYNTADISLKEIKLTLKKMKRRKAPGPDEIPMEIVKEMDDHCLALIAELLNSWWKAEDIPEDMLQARVVLVHKKGDTSKFENYSPISLLNSSYKIYAAIIQKRFAKVVDKK